MAEGRTDKEVSETNGDEAQDIGSMTDPIPPVTAPEQWDKEADVVIIGGGGAGLSAAAKALDNGATVLVLEKNPDTGGISQNSIMAASFNTKQAKRKGLKTDTAKAFKHAYAVQSNATIDPKILKALIDRSHEIYDWSETQSWGKGWDAITLDFIPDQGVVRMIVKGALRDAPFTCAAKFTAQMYPFLNWLKKYVSEEKGGEILVNTKARTLVKDKGRVIGVQAETEDGKIIYAKANKGVVLAGASFSNNREMLKKYCPDVYKKAVATFLPPYDTGEVVRMAWGAGADFAGKDSWMAFSGGIPMYDTNYTGKSEPGPWFQYLRQGWLQLARGGGWLEVNSACEEYLPEVSRADYEMHPKATAGQAGAAGYVIFDANYPKTIWETLPEPLLDDRPMTPDEPEDPWFGKFSHFMPKNWLDSVDQAIELGGVKVSDTLEGLAKELGLDPHRFVDAVKAWNEKATAGKVDKFGRLPQNMKPIVKGPFYGLKTGAILGALYCGARVNYKFEVLDEEQKPIPGLYAAGQSAGATNGEGIMNPSALSGVGLSFCSGWIAGDTVSGDKSNYEPDEMEITSEIRLQRLVNLLNRHFPRLGAIMLSMGSFAFKKKQQILNRMGKK